ncbi:acVLRF1 family peptidyl-tRNA hydrolase [Phycicoccus sp.]|uniref:acVLRF1 family peptidyl-tRNA hydrolase n=1 Tax=Phycicoccus sp. TaxID=1902410 RepID=UPI002BAAA557|nr:acVLRF1 family peptidyl-tRNA hydrolase [Phycicoccus sp.]HMM94437.1 acVLRF1 family peptidyl-tRNA hydrolase [Phycicoccus sp.]
MSTRVVEVAPERYDRWRARFDENNPDGPQRVVGVSRLEADPLALLLVRRGGYAVGVASGPRLTAHKVGTRYVQSRTAAGGWSQQRFARRRGNQADELVGVVAGHAVRLLTGAGARGLVLGGDRALAESVLDDPRLAALRALPRRELYDLPDPRLAVLETALERARAVRVTIEE